MTGRINWRQLGLLAMAIITVQFVYWALIDKPLFNADRAKAPPMAEFTFAQVARLSEPSLAAARTARFEPVELPWTYCCDTAIHAVRIGFTVDDVPPAGMGLISTLQVDNYLLAVNDTLLVGEGRMQPGRGTFHGQKMFLTRIPAGILKQGENTLTYVTLRDGFPYADIDAPLIGEYQAMQAFSANRLWNTNEFHRYGAGLLGLLGMLAAIMVVRSEDWRFAAWLSALCAAFVGNYLYGIVLDPPFDGWGRMVAFFAVNMAVPVTLLCFIDAWTGRPLRHLQTAAVAAYVAAMGYAVWRIYFTPMPDGFDTPAVIWTWFLGTFAVLAAVRMLWHFARHREDRVLESALLSVCVVAVLLDGASEWYPQLSGGNLSNAAPLLMLAMLAAFLARNFRLFQSQATLTASLRAQVAEREAELAQAHAREQDLVRKQAHDAERRRIMQDIHDGLGSQLMSMMLAARLGEAEPVQVAEGLQAVIDEMRLMIDSMDSVGESLEAALATFRTRIQPRVAGAGYTFTWAQPDLHATATAGFGPRDVLQIFRVMQEAVTNALKHSGGNRIGITVSASPAGELRIAIADNGRGGAQASAGRGLANMVRRAKAIGGELTVTSQPGDGTRVELTLCQPQPDADCHIPASSMA